jgi:unspecific peroxygenase
MNTVSLHGKTMIRLFGLTVLAFASIVASFPSYGSLAGLSEVVLAAIIPTLHVRDAEPAPGPLKFNGTKLVNDKDHPWKPLQPGDIRGPCPGLNTLASHGVCPKNFSVFLMSETFARAVSST